MFYRMPITLPAKCNLLSIAQVERKHFNDSSTHRLFFNCVNITFAVTLQSPMNVSRRLDKPFIIRTTKCNGWPYRYKRSLSDNLFMNRIKKFKDPAMYISFSFV